MTRNCQIDTPTSGPGWPLDHKCHFGKCPEQPPLTKTTAPNSAHSLNPFPADTKPKWLINSYLKLF